MLTLEGEVRYLKTFAAQLQAALDRLYPFKIGAKGDLQEWFEDWESSDPHHRHISHLLGLYPGRLITRQGTPELFNAARQSLELACECDAILALYAEDVEFQRPSTTLIYRFVPSPIAVQYQILSLTGKKPKASARQMAFDFPRYFDEAIAVHAVERAMVTSKGTVLGEEEFSFLWGGRVAKTFQMPAGMTMQEMERQLIIATSREGGDRVRVAVQDVGVGFDPQSVDKLFDIFYTTKSSGMGVAK